MVLGGKSIQVPGSFSFLGIPSSWLQVRVHGCIESRVTTLPYPKCRTQPHGWGPRTLCPGVHAAPKLIRLAMCYIVRNQHHQQQHRHCSACMSGPPLQSAKDALPISPLDRVPFPLCVTTSPSRTHFHSPVAPSSFILCSVTQHPGVGAGEQSCSQLRQLPSAASQPPIFFSASSST